MDPHVLGRYTLHTIFNSLHARGDIGTRTKGEVESVKVVYPVITFRVELLLFVSGHEHLHSQLERLLGRHVLLGQIGEKINKGIQLIYKVSKC